MGDRFISRDQEYFRKNIARIIVARMLLRSLFKMLKDQVRFNQARVA